MSSKPRFVISKRGVLEKCYGPEGEVLLPEGVKVIGEKAFEDRRSVVRVTLPKGINRIEEGAFQGCWALETVDIPEGVTIIGDRAFSYSGLTSVTIPESVKRIGYEAFAHCNKLTGVTVPRDIDIRISSSAFGDCPALTGVVIPKGVTEIESETFASCPGLGSITIPASVTKIDEYAFGEGFCNGPCENLTIHAPAGSCAERYAGKKGFGFVAEGVAVTENVQDFIIKNGVLTKYDGSGGDVTIPAGVTLIRYQAFNGFKKLTGVTIPEGVKKIQNGAFCGTGLTSITIPEGVTEISSGTFCRCTGLKNVDIPEGVKKINSYAFIDCTSLTCMTIPKSVTEIGEKSFARCTGLASVTILGSAAKIDKTAFEGCCPVIIAPHIPFDNFAPAVRPDAVRGFARLYLEGVELDEEIRIGYLKYIKGNKKRLYPTVIEEEALLRLMLAEKLVTKNDIQPLLDEADKQGNTAAKAALLDRKPRV